MASFCEPMDVDEVEPDDKENAFRPNGAESLSAVAGDEDLDVSELNMKLRLSCTPLASPAPARRTFTGSCKKLFPESGDSEALNSTVSSGDSNITLTEFSMGDYNGSSPLSQNSTCSTIRSQEDDQNKNETILYKSFDDSAILSDCTLNNNSKNIIEPIDNRELVLTTSASISITTDDKTPTKSIPKNSTSPIMRGLKSVLSIFRHSQSPVTSDVDIIPASEDINSDDDTVSPNTSHLNISQSNSVLASTPVHGDEELKKSVDQMSLKGSSPHIPESIVFNDDLINDLHWNDDTTIIFNKNKLPGRKLCTPSLRESNSSFGSCSRESIPSTEILKDEIYQIYSQDKIPDLSTTRNVTDTTVECMDISINDSNCNEVSKFEDHKVGSLDISNQTECISKTEGVLGSVDKSVENSVQKSLYTVTYQTENVGTYDNNGNKSQLEDNMTHSVDQNLSIADTACLTKQSSCKNTLNGSTFIEKKVIDSDRNNLLLSERDICLSATCPSEESSLPIEEIKSKGNVPMSTKNTTEINLSIEGIKNHIVENKYHDSENLIENTEKYDHTVCSKNISTISNTVTNHKQEDNIVAGESLPSAGFNPNAGKVISEGNINEHKKVVVSTKNATERNFSVDEITTHTSENKLDIDYSKNAIETSDSDNYVLCSEAIPTLSNIVTVTVQAEDIITEESSKLAGLIPNGGEIVSEEIIDINELATSTKNTTAKKISVRVITTPIVEDQLKIDHGNNLMESMENMNSLLCCETISSLSNIATIYQQDCNIISEECTLSSGLVENTSETISINEKSIIHEPNKELNIEVVIGTKKPECKYVTENSTKMLDLDDSSFKKISNIFEDEEIVTSENNSPYVSLNAPVNPESIDKLPETEGLEIDFDSIENPFITKSRVSVTPPLKKNHSETGNILITSPTGHLSNKNNQEDINLQPLSKLMYDNNSDADKIERGVSVDTANNNPNNITFEVNDNESSSIGLLSSILNDETTNDCSVTYETVVQKELRDNHVEISSNLDNDTIKTDINLTPCESDIVNNIDSQDQSDAYLSADSSDRESEHLLDNEIIDITSEIVSEMKHKENIIMSVAKCLDANAATSVTEESEKFDNCIDPFTTKTSMILSPPSRQNDCSEFVKLSDCDNGLYTIDFKSKPIISHVLKDNSSLKIREKDTIIEASSDIKAKTEVAGLPAIQYDNPLATRTKIRMSPPLINNTYEVKEWSEVMGKSEIPLKSEEHFNEKYDDSQMNAIQSTLLAKRDTPSKTEEINIVVESDNGILMNLPSEKEDIKEVPRPQNVNMSDAIENSQNVSQYDNTIKLEKTPLPDVHNPFTTNIKIMMSPPNTSYCKTRNDSKLECMDPFLTKNKIRMSPPRSSNTKHVQEIVEINTTFDLTENDLQAIPNSDFKVNIHDLDKSYIPSPIKSGNDETISSGNSIVSGDADQTTMEVKTEDEDTMEGPDFVDLETNNDKTFENYPQIERERSGPKVILCSDEPPLLSSDIENTNEEFIDCTGEQFYPGELFINADTFDYLMNQNATTNETNDNGKESLFLKFDPLCSNKRKSTGIVELGDPDCDINEGTSHTEVINQEINSLQPVSDEKSPQKYGQTQENVHNVGEQLFVSACSTPPEKPVMAVIPAVYNDHAITPRSATYTPTRPERRSMTFSSPAIAAIDRLISLSGNNSPLNQTYTENYAPSHESNEAIIELRALLAEKELQVEQLRTEARGLQERLTDLEIQMNGLQEENDDRLVKLNSLQAKLAQKTALNHNMAATVEEYERVISGLIGDNEQERQQHEQERAVLVRERDEQVAHLNSMEVSFSDLHTKYERTKQVISTYKANEDALRKTIEKYKESQQKLESNCETLKQQAMSKLNNVNMEIEKLKKGHESEVLKLTALVKRKEMHATSLEETLAQKVKANEELTAICDELISKVG